MRNLQKAARACVEQYDGQLPGDFEELKRLPGVGEYTAGAIGSIAFGLPVTAVDGNVFRVMTRLTADSSDVTSPETKNASPRWCRTFSRRTVPGISTRR